MQTAIHTQLGGTYGSGNCDRNGCFARVGGPQSPPELQDAYGPGVGGRSALRARPRATRPHRQYTQTRLTRTPARALAS
eukprot:3640482-Prymnesium_polylepis.2